MIDPGALSRRLVIEAPVETDDGAGGVTRSYTDTAVIWAAISPVSSRGAFEADAAGATVTHRIIIRSGAELTTAHRLRDGSRRFRIVSLREQASNRRFTEIRAEERVG